MANPISGAGNLHPLSLPNAVPGPALRPTNDEAVSFQNLLLDSLGQTAALEQSAQTAIGHSLAGEDITQVEVFSAVKKADLALRMMLQVRNKVLEAYSEIKQMQM